MGSTEQFTEELSKLDVSNIFIYVGDAVRWTERPESICEMGTCLRMMTASTWSPSSFATLITGMYPPNHGVWSFLNQIPTDLHTILEDNIHTRFLNSVFKYAEPHIDTEHDPIHSVLKVNPLSFNSPFEGLSEPFICMERGPGGHAPWGDFRGTATDYFKRQKNSSRNDLLKDYRKSVSQDENLFSKRVSELDEMGIKEDTLIIYISDHGEVIGERGLLGHGGPISPELVHVPAVFIHPSISSRTISNRTPHHADIAPTIRSILGTDSSTSPDGNSLTDRVPSQPRPCFLKHPFLPSSIPLLTGQLTYESVWDEQGGIVFRRSNLLDSSSIFLAKLIKSSKKGYMRRELISGFQNYVGEETIYGNPSFTRDDAEKIIEKSIKTNTTQANSNLSEEGKEHLENLGYL